MELQILRRETCALADARQHARADLLAFVKCKDDVKPSLSLEDAMTFRTDV